MIKIQDKIRIRKMMSRGNAKFSYDGKTRNDVVQLRNSINSGTFLIFIFRWHAYSSQNVIFCHRFFRCKLPVEVVDVEVKVMSMLGMHIFKRIE